MQNTLEPNQNTDKLVKKGFGFVNNQFINIYSDENPIIPNDEECYFLFYHPANYHRTLIGKGKIVNQLLNDGLNVIYFIALEEFCENEDVMKKFVYNLRFPLFKLDDENVLRNKSLIISEKTSMYFLSSNLFKVESFFVRKTLKDIQELQQEYSKIIKQDIQKQLEDINDILTSK
jgi:hypothetical protein